MIIANGFILPLATTFEVIVILTLLFSASSFRSILSFQSSEYQLIQQISVIMYYIIHIYVILTECISCYWKPVGSCMLNSFHLMLADPNWQLSWMHYGWRNGLGKNTAVYSFALDCPGTNDSLAFGHIVGTWLSSAQLNEASLAAVVWIFFSNNGHLSYSIAHFFKCFDGSKEWLY